MITVRPARLEALDEVARIWAESWASSGLATGVGDSRPELRARAREVLADGMWLRTPAANARAGAWYEARGFVLRKVEPHPAAPFDCAYDDWRPGR